MVRHEPKACNAKEAILGSSERRGPASQPPQPSRTGPDVGRHSSSIVGIIPAALAGGSVKALMELQVRRRRYGDRLGLSRFRMGARVSR
jgi:hypothetical protein